MFLANRYFVIRSPDCRYDRSDVQSVGKTTMFRSRASSQSAATLIGTDDFEQLGFHVQVARYDGQDVVIVAAGTAGACLRRMRRAGHVTR